MTKGTHSSLSLSSSFGQRRNWRIESVTAGCRAHAREESGSTLEPGHVMEDGGCPVGPTRMGSWGGNMGAQLNMKSRVGVLLE